MSALRLVRIRGKSVTGEEVEFLADPYDLAIEWREGECKKSSFISTLIFQEERILTDRRREIVAEMSAMVQRMVLQIRSIINDEGITQEKKIEKLEGLGSGFVDEVKEFIFQVNPGAQELDGMYDLFHRHTFWYKGEL